MGKADLPIEHKWYDRLTACHDTVWFWGLMAKLCSPVLGPSPFLPPRSGAEPAGLDRPGWLPADKPQQQWVNG